MSAEYSYIMSQSSNWWTFHSFIEAFPAAIITTDIRRELHHIFKIKFLYWYMTSQWCDRKWNVRDRILKNFTWRLQNNLTFERPPCIDRGYNSQLFRQWRLVQGHLSDASDLERKLPRKSQRKVHLNSVALSTSLQVLLTKRV